MPGATMTTMEALDYIRAMEPADLGLTGESMEEYRIYALDGVVKVDDIPCLHVNIYQTDNPAGSNAVAGNFFISADGQHIYRLDVETNTVEEVHPEQ